MGSCFSKKGMGEKAAWRAASARLAHPEPEAPQEEAVKEVLSETPKPRLSRPKEEEKREFLVEKSGAGLGLANGCCDERSEEASEICSLSESFSTTVTERKGDLEEYGEVRRREERSPGKLQRKRSVSGELSCKRDRCAAAGGGGSARSSPSPARKRDGGVGRTLSARETGQAGRTRVGGGYGLCRDPGDRSGRRSVSPAPKRVAEQRVGTGVGGQCRGLATARVNGRVSPRRVPAAPLEYGARRGEDGDAGGDGDVNGNGSGNGYTPGKESLENPLVSLECFIFL